MTSTPQLQAPHVAKLSSPRGISQRARRAFKVTIYHNILWPRYKGAIFTRLFALCRGTGIDASFVQIAETAAGYSELGAVDLSYHSYPFRLLIKGSYAKASRLQRVWVTGRDLLRNPCDLVVLPGYELVEFWVMLALCMVLGRRRAVFCDSTGLDTRKSFLKEFAKRMFFSRCDGFLCYGERSREYVSSYGVPASKIYYRCQAAALPHGYDPALVQGNYAAQAQPAGEAPHFLFLGRLSVEKGLHDLLEAFSLVHARFNGARLCLVGAGPQEAALREQISRLGLQDAVELPGPRTLEQVVPLFYRSVALVLPSYREPWGLVVNESLSYGCPVVVSDRCGCVPELVIEGVTGYAIPAGNVAKLSGAMLAAVALSADRAATAARCLKVMSAFTPESAAEEILRGCREIVAARA